MKAVDDFRAKEMAQLPSWYSPWAHLASTLGIGLIALILAISQIESLKWQELWVVPVMFVIANFAEWQAHRTLLHQRRSGFWSALYEQHTPRHHRIYRQRDMAVQDWRELKFVLMPARGVLALVLGTVPVALVTGLAFGQNVGWVTMTTEALYVVMYEVTHLCYHLPTNHPIKRIGVIRSLAEHHARHHDPRLMQKWNFNVTVPLSDWLLGTMVPKKNLEQNPDERTGSPAPVDWD